MIKYIYAARKHLYGKMAQSDFLSNIAILTAGSAGAQIIAIAFMPILTRLYGPEAFGILGTFMAITALALPLATLTYPLAIALPRSNEDAADIITISFVILSISTLIIFASGFFQLSWLKLIFGENYNTHFVLLVPLFVFFLSAYQILEQWLIRQKKFSAISKVTFMSALFGNLSKLCLGYFSAAGLILIYISVLNIGLQVVSTIFFLKYFKQIRFIFRDYRSIFRPMSKYRNILYTYRDFPLYRAPQIFINTVSESLPILMLTIFFGPASAGYYSVSRLILGTPTSVVGKAITDAFYPKIVEASRGRERLSSTIIRPTYYLIIISILPFALLFLFAPAIFSWTFGFQWRDAGVYTSWLSVFFFFNFINKPSVAAVPVLGIQKGLLMYEIISTGTKIIALAVGFYQIRSDVWAIALFSCAGAAAYVFMMIWIYLRAKNWEKS